MDIDQTLRGSGDNIYQDVSWAEQRVSAS